jgi:hypothetical protein
MNAVLEMILTGLCICSLGGLFLLLYCVLTVGKRADENHIPPKMDKWD